MSSFITVLVQLLSHAKLVLKNVSEGLTTNFIIMVLQNYHAFTSTQKMCCSTTFKLEKKVKFYVLLRMLLQRWDTQIGCEYMGSSWDLTWAKNNIWNWKNVLNFLTLLAVVNVLNLWAFVFKICILSSWDCPRIMQNFVKFWFGFGFKLLVVSANICHQLKSPSSLQFMFITL